MININSRGTSPAKIGLNDYVICSELTSVITSDTTITTSTVTSSTTVTTTSSQPLNVQNNEADELTTITLCTTVIDGCDEYETETALITTDPGTATVPVSSIATTITSSNPHLNQATTTCSNTETVYGGEQDFAISVSKPLDISFEEGEIGNQIIWAIAAAQPHHYEIYKDNQIIQNNPFTEPTGVSVPLDDLNPGDYLFQIVVYDTWGQMITDEVNVHVIPKPVPSATSENIKDPSESDTNGNLTIPIPIFFVSLGIFVSIIFIRSKRS